MTTENVKNWLKAKTDVGTGIYVGKVEEKQDKCIGVYDSKSSGKQQVCIGGKSNTKLQEKAVTILVHWTSSATEAEKKAREVYDLFWGMSRTDMDGVMVVSADPGKQPDWAGKSPNGICEYVIRVKLNYERNDENA